MPTTLSGIYHSEIKLTRSTPNPVTITASGTVSTATADALYGERGTAWDVTNLGLLSGKRLGVTLATGGTVVNGSAANAGATIKGGLGGLVVHGAVGSVANYGTIRGASAAGYGAKLLLGGQLSNAATGTISGGEVGVLIQTAAGTVLNDGAIRATNGHSIGVELETGGAVVNGAGDAAATIDGAKAGVWFRGSVSVTNFGTITATAGSGVYGGIAGVVVNGGAGAAGALIKGSIYGVQLVAADGQVSTLTNFGTLVGVAEAGAYLNGQGYVMNAASAMMQGGEYGLFTKGTATIVNYGTIVGTGALAAHYRFPPPAPPAKPGPIPGSFGVDMSHGGAFQNGSATDRAAYVHGSFIGLQVHDGVATVQNFGTIKGGVVGVYTWVGGTVVNGSEADHAALISGNLLGTWNTYPGGAIRNYGTITSARGSGVDLAAGGHPGSAGMVVNGSTTDMAALISGGTNGVTTVSDATVMNYGTLVGTIGVGAYITAGGVLINGSHADESALITGKLAGATLKGAVMTLTNYGTISGTAMGAGLYSGGSVLNGLGGDPGALIAGGSGPAVYIHAAVGTVMNHGTIISTAGYGVLFTSGGQVVNGDTSVHRALISGTEGVDILAGVGVLVSNQGTIRGTSKAGVELATGGTVRNGAGASEMALITGVSYGVYVHAAGAGSVVNDGTIQATGASGIGIYLRGGGTVQNGLTTDVAATITGARDGIDLLAGSSIVNDGTIAGTSRYGVNLILGGTVINGSKLDHAALISGGRLGVYLRGANGQVDNDGRILGNTQAVYLPSGGVIINHGTISGGSGIVFGHPSSATVTNAGLIAGTGGEALVFGDGVNRLVVDAGASFQGQVDGSAGTSVLELAAVGTGGVMAGLGSQFVGFAGLSVDAGAAWTLTGANVTGSLLDQGTLEVAAGGSLHVGGTVDPTGTGTIDLLAGATLDLAAMPASGAAITFLGGASLVVDTTSLSGGGSPVMPTLHGFGVGDSIDLRDLALAGTSLGYDPVQGLLQVYAGGATVADLNIAAAGLGGLTFHLGDDGTGHSLIGLV